LRSVKPPLEAGVGRRITGVRRLGKRIALELEGELFYVVHPMIAGRFQWRAAEAGLGKIVHLAFDLGPLGGEPGATLLLTEASKQKRATLHVVSGEDALEAHDPGGLDVLAADLAVFRARLEGAKHTLKRALTSPRLLDGIGNAYSDEILHAAQLSPFKRIASLRDEEWAALHAACQEVLRSWSERLIRETGEAWPSKVTAFRPEMAVHGKAGQPCPRCEAPVQRIRYTKNEANYCAACQTGGKLLADRALSRLLKEDWPKTLEELERLPGRERT
jgi:formamidopyrimidine-DNA glycosylase